MGEVLRQAGSEFRLRGSGVKSGGSKGGGGGGGRSVSAAVGTARNFGSFLLRVQEAGP